MYLSFLLPLHLNSNNMKKLSLEALNRLSIEDYKKADKNPIIVVLDNIRSLNNIGSIFRTADAFRIEAIYLCGITAKPPHRDIHKTALGATESVDWKYFENTINALSFLKTQGYCLLALEQVDESVLLYEFKPKVTGKYALIAFCIQ